MKGRYLVGALAAVIGLAVLAACGGDDDSDGGGSTSGIRTQKGLAVAALAQNLGLGGDAVTGGSGGTSGSETADLGPAIGQVPPVSYDRGSAKSGYGGDIAGFPIGPFQQGGTNGLTVQGYGTASAPADSAIIDFYFYRNSVVEPVPFPEGRSSDQAAVEEITEANLQPVIDALVAAGVPRDDIEFIEQSYYDKFSSSATLRVTIKNIDALDAALSAAENAAGGLGDITFSEGITYTVGNCEALEIEAMKAAVEDTGERAANFASALGVQIGGIVGAANYSYFGGPPCGAGFGGPIPLGVAADYGAGGSREVQVFANITVTYAIQ